MTGPGRAAIVVPMAVETRPGLGPKDVVPAVASAAFALHVIALLPYLGFDDTGPDPAIGTIAAAVVGSAALIGRRWFTIPVLVVVLGLRVLMTAGAGDEFALLPAALLALYTAAGSGPRRRAIAISAAAAVVMAVLVAVAEQDESFVQELLSELAIGLLPVAVADGVRSRADRLRDLIDGEAEARVQAERLRIARDLHDVVAHGLSTIAVQSGVASHLLDRNPDQAREALDVINATGKRSLEELRTMVGVLRSTDEAPLMPTPTDPNDLSLVLDAARSTSAGDRGFEVETVGAFPADASEAAVVAVHRILAEAVANATRHGDGPTTVHLEHGSDEARLRVTNPLRGTAAAATGADGPSTGVGIIGMTERAESMGGTLVAEPTSDGQFAVEATVPYRRGRS